ncbi:MAG: 50S ribosomal protein L11 methyltransferase [Desulfobacterales bacterium]|jgi:ribosomal protein L11 methyltransferase
MNDSSSSHPASAKSGSCPYDDLYIYQLGGKLTSHKEIPRSSFIGNWEEEDFSFLFFSQPAYEEIKVLLSAQPHLAFIDSYHMPYEQWQGTEFATFDQGCFKIIPPWENGSNVGPNKLPIILDPGIVFGTGTHPTTRDCLDAVQLACRGRAPDRVLDLGTGTGLLALAAARLGCRLNLAVDLNLLAAKTAEKNVRLNGLGKQVAVVQGYAEAFIDCPADLLIANIHYSVMQKLICAKGFSTKKRFILSGLLRGEAKQVRIELERLPAKILKSWTHEGIWHTFYGKMANQGI